MLDPQAEHGWYDALMRQLIVAYSMAEVLVTNDSGPAHFATVTLIDVVTLFGPETPELFAARSPRNHVVWRRPACSPCVSALNNRVSHCRDNVCMQHIDVEEVYQSVCAILAQRGHGAQPSVPGADSVNRGATSSMVAE